VFVATYLADGMSVERVERWVQSPDPFDLVPAPVDYAPRMDFRDQDGQSLPPWDERPQQLSEILGLGSTSRRPTISAPPRPAAGQHAVCIEDGQPRSAVRHRDTAGRKSTPSTAHRAQPSQWAHL